jgi:hypothetical protein
MVGLPRIEVLRVDSLNAFGCSRITLEDGTFFESYVVLHHVDGMNLFEVEMPTGIFKGKMCLLHPATFNRFKPEAYDNAW